MGKIISVLLISFICVGCMTQQEKTSHHTSFPEMSPLYMFQNTQEMENVDLKVYGKIPEWLQGDFVRNGPGLIRTKTSSIKSWFDGLGKLHAFSINNGRVLYTCKFLRSAAYEKFKTTGEFDFVGFAQEPKTDPFSLIDFLFDVKNEEVTNANVTISKINNHRVAMTEIPLPVEISKSLDTKGPFDYDDDLPKNYSFESAHILEDPQTKAMWNFLIKIGLFETAYQIYSISPHSNSRQLVSSIPVSSISYMHSFSLAGKYFVLVDYPFRAKDPKDIAHGFIKAFSWYQNEPTKIYVINRESGQFWTFYTKPFFSYHHINGFEKDNKIFVDLIAYPDADIIYNVNKYPFIKNPNNKLYRLEIDCLKNQTNVYQVTHEHFEFPRLNDSRIGKEYQYFYAVHIHPNGYGILKYNHFKAKNTTWFREGFYAGEPVYIPHPQAKAEDDGVILTIVNNLKEKTSFLLILDAKELKELARIEAPHFIPFGFHGRFFEEDSPSPYTQRISSFRAGTRGRAR